MCSHGASPLGWMLRGGGGLLIAALVALLALAAPAGAITPTDDATVLGNAALRNPNMLTSAAFDVAAGPSATSVATEAMAGFPEHGSDYLVVSSGDATLAPNAAQDGLASQDNAGGTRGEAQNVVVLRLNIDVPTAANCLSMKFRFFSEEYPEFLNGNYNDGFLAELDPTTPWTMSNHQIIAPSNFAYMPDGAFVSINSAPMTAPDAAGTVYDGGTTLLSASTQVTPGAHALVLSVWDDGDAGHDSAAFIDDVRTFTAGAGGCAGGAVAPPSDTTAPDTTITVAPSGTTGSSTSFSFTANEAGSSFECRLDGEAWSACTSAHPLTGLSSGSHTFETRAVDGAGNTDATPALHTWTVDVTPPAAPVILSGPSRITTEMSASFALAGEPSATMECRLDAGAWIVCPPAHDLEGLALGEHLLEVRQTDLAGNVSPLAQLLWTIVRVEPDATPAPPAPPASPAPPAPPAAPQTLAGLVGVRVPGSRFPTAVAEAGIVPAACAVEGGSITRCAVVVRVGGRIVGRGVVRYARNGRSSARVRVLLFPGMRARLMSTHKLIKATFTFTAQVSGRSQPMVARRTVVLGARYQYVLPSDGLFESGSARLVAKVRRYLRGIAPALISAKRIRCVGHTDSIGTQARNRRLGLRRARAVCGMLRRLGVSGRLVAESRGETRPRSTNASRLGRQSNRRVSVRVLR